MFLLMRAKTLTKKIVISVLVLAFIVGSAARIWYVNANAYKQDYEYYNVCDWVPLEGSFFANRENETNDYYSVRISQAEVLTYAEFMAMFDKDESYLGSKRRYDVILLKVDFKNDGDELGGVYIHEFNIKDESKSTYYNFDTTYMKIANSNLGNIIAGINVQPHTEASMYFVYPTDGRADGITLLQELEEKGVTDFTMCLDVSRYPVTKTITFDLTMPENN